MAAVSIPGGIDVASDTASFERNYGGNAIGLSIAPETADIQVLIYPLKHTGNDTIVVKGRMLNELIDRNHCTGPVIS